ncbi:MAG: hypothetical protein H6R24_1836 [Proteobacteria bacterium]|nr:hypothetical protein [Pseudomonadota bacterium]
MIEQILLSSDSFAGIRETGGFGQPLHALYPQIRAVLASELGPETAGFLAEPVVDRANNRIDWYTEGDPDHPPVALSDLPEEQRQPMLAQVHDLLKRGREVAERYAGSAEARRAQLGAMLRAALGAPAETEVFLVEGRPVMIRWGFVPDRPWETLAEPARSPVVSPSAPGSAELPRNVAMPEVAMPELAAEPESGGEPPPESPPAKPLAELLPESSPTSPREPAASQAIPEPALEPPLESKPLPAAKGSDSSPEPESTPDTGWRYVVVGSRYFWSVFALALLLAVIAAAWRGLGQSSLLPILDEKSGLTPDADLDRALTQAQRTEFELRTRLESLLAQLAGRRGQCPLPAAGADAPPVAREPLGGSRTVPTQSTVAVAAAESPRRPDSKAPVSDRAAVPSTETPTSPARTMSSPESTVGFPDSVGALPAKTESGASSGTVGALPAETESRTSAGMESPARTLEDVLAERAPAAAAPARQPSRGQTESPVKDEPSLAKVEPPVKAEPTPEERREFASRLSAAGAATGEITATLLWNSPGDLDLVVRCPSGQQLDYRNPTACGGALDVDANAARASLSDRPVENAFWPASRAAPGTYEIAVRYAPRKDEQNPGETPFQVRLIRGGQESVFKGAIRPNTVTPVTTFAVER